MIKAKSAITAIAVMIGSTFFPLTASAAAPNILTPPSVSLSGSTLTVTPATYTGGIVESIDLYACNGPLTLTLGIYTRMYTTAYTDGNEDWLIGNSNNPGGSGNNFFSTVRCLALTLPTAGVNQYRIHSGVVGANRSVGDNLEVAFNRELHGRHIVAVSRSFNQADNSYYQFVSDSVNLDPGLVTITPDVIETKQSVSDNLRYPHSGFAPASLPVAHSNGGGIGIDVAMTFSQNAVATAAANSGYTITANTVLCGLSYTVSGYTNGNFGFGVLGFDNSGTQASPVVVPDLNVYSGNSYSGIYFMYGAALGQVVPLASAQGISVVSPIVQPAASTNIRSLSSRLNTTNFNWSKLSTGKLTMYAYAVGGTQASPAQESVQGLTLQASLAENTCAKTVTFNANQGTGSMNAQTSATAANLTANSFTRPGFIFTGWNTTANGLGLAYADAASFPFTLSDTLYAQWTAGQAPNQAAAPYEGPVLGTFSDRNLDPCTPKSITITGTKLSGAKGSIQGKAVTVLENTDTKLVIATPAGLTPARGVDLVITSPYGTLTHQNAFDIPAGVCSQTLSKGRWTQIQSDGKTVKMYAKDPIGDGKIQFFVDGKELAWITAVDATDPKLSFASSFPYLVRSVDLKPGKNRFEIRVDGKRVWRATYVPQG